MHWINILDGINAGLRTAAAAAAHLFWSLN